MFIYSWNQNRKNVKRAKPLNFHDFFPTKKYTKNKTKIIISPHWIPAFFSAKMSANGKLSKTMEFDGIFLDQWWAIKLVTIWRIWNDNKMFRNPRNLTVRFPLVDIFSFLLKFPRVIVTQDLQLNEAGRELTWFSNFIMRFSWESSRKRQNKGIS